MATMCAITIGLRLSQETIELIGLSFVVTVVIAIIGLFCLFGAVGWQGFRWLRIWVNKAEFKARVISTEHGTWFIAHPKIDIAPLHNTPYLRINGHERELTPDERFYSTLQAPQNRANGATALLPAPQPEQQLDLLTLINQYPHVHIFGRTGNGKTSLLRTIGYNRIAAGHQVFVLDSNDHPAEWTGLTRIKDEQEQDSFIANALELHRLNSTALADGRAIEGDFEQITILSNEWTDIVRRTESAATFIDEMSRKSRKSGFHCGFSTQTKLAADLGLDGRYQVVRNFLQVELLVSTDGRHTARCIADGRVIAELDIPAPPPRPIMLSSGYTPPSITQVRVGEVIPTRTKDKAELIRDNLESILSDGLPHATTEIKQVMEAEGFISSDEDWAYIRSVANRAGMTKAGHGYWQL